MKATALIVVLAVGCLPVAFAQKGPQPGSNLANPSTREPYTVHQVKKKNKRKGAKYKAQNSNPQARLSALAV